MSAVGVCRSGVRIRCVRIVMMPVVRVVRRVMRKREAARADAPGLADDWMRTGEAARADARPHGHDDDGVPRAERLDGIARA